MYVSAHSQNVWFQDLINIDNGRYVMLWAFVSAVRASTDHAVIKCVSPVDLSFNYNVHNAPAYKFNKSTTSVDPAYQIST